MDWLILSKDGKTIENVIVAEEADAAAFGGIPYYDGAAIGGSYSPPRPQRELTEYERMQQEITDLMLTDIEQGQHQTEMEVSILEGIKMVKNVGGGALNN